MKREKPRTKSCDACGRYHHLIVALLRKSGGRIMLTPEAFEGCGAFYLSQPTSDTMLIELADTGDPRHEHL